KKIVRSAVMHRVPQANVLRRALLTMVKTCFFRKIPGLPALHPRGEHGGQIDTARLDRLITPDFDEACAPEELTRARDVLDARESVVLPPVLAERRPPDSEPRIVREPREQERKVVRFERDVGVQVRDDVVVEILELCAPRIERQYLSGE